MPKPKSDHNVGVFDANSPSLLERAKHLLAESNMSLSKISIKTGLSYYWLRQLHLNTSKSPSVNKVQCLYEYLSNENLFNDVDCKFTYDSDED